MLISDKLSPFWSNKMSSYKKKANPAVLILDPNKFHHFLPEAVEELSEKRVF